MIKRLKRRFIAVNMSILTCVLFGILATIFIFMYNSEVNLSYKLMESILTQKDIGKNPINNLSTEMIDFSNISLLNNEFDNPENYNDEYDDEHWFKHDQKDPPPPFDPNFNDDEKEHPTISTDDSSEMITESTENNNNETVETTVSTVQNKSNETKIQSSEANNKNNSFINNEKPKHDINNESLTDDSIVTKASSTKLSESKQQTNVTSSVTNSKPSEKTSEKSDDKTNKFVPDPFKGKVKRSYVYVEFDNINNIESIIYQYCDTNDNESVKNAAKKIYNQKKDHGKITIGNDKYRFLFRYEPPKMKYSIIFLDRTLEISTMNRLLFIFIIIAGIGMVFIFFISILLANWTIKPVSKAWNQQKQFIADASHELKTPLTVISTNTDVILSNPEDSVKNQSKWLNYIKNETERMTKLVNSLLYIAKYDSNKIKLAYNKIDLSNIISSICLQYEPMVFESDKTLITDIDDNINLLGDEDKFKQLVNILMDNALKYSLDKGIIKVSLKKIKQTSVCLTISNSSENIDKNQLDKIFDRFYRVDDSRNRKTGGSGLGLNIAKTIVDSHKGSIHVVNNDNITSFIITF